MCRECWDNKELCDACATSGQTSIYPQLHACFTCIDDNVKCVKSAVFAYVADCEEGNKKGIEMFKLEDPQGNVDPECALLVQMQSM